MCDVYPIAAAGRARQPLPKEREKAGGKKTHETELERGSATASHRHAARERDVRAAVAEPVQSQRAPHTATSPALHRRRAHPPVARRMQQLLQLPRALKKQRT
jgi:hypothetical protein